MASVDHDAVFYLLVKNSTGYCNLRELKKYWILQRTIDQFQRNSKNPIAPVY